MRIAYNKMGQPNGQVIDVDRQLVRIGAGQENDVVLSSPFIAPQAAVLSKAGSHWELTPLGENEILVGQQAVRPGERAVVGAHEAIRIYPYSLTLDYPEVAHTSVGEHREEMDRQLSRLLLDAHDQILSRLEITDTDESRRDDDNFLLRVERDLEEIARMLGFCEAQRNPLLLHCAGHTAKSRLLAKIIEEGSQTQPASRSTDRWTRMHTAVTDYEQELEALIDKLSSDFGLSGTKDVSQQIERVEQNYWDRWTELQAELYPDFTKYLAVSNLKKQIKDILFGYGPLEDLIRMPNITEIMVVSRDKIYVEKSGVLEKSGRQFVSDDVTVSIIDRIVARVGRRIDKSQPLVDARLVDGSRVNAVISPLAVSGPSLTIRKFPSKRLRAGDLVKMGSLTHAASEFLRAAVISGKNIVVSGGTGTGKTTMLNCLSNFIPGKERIVTIEDTAELQLQKEHVVRMETKTANVEGTGEYTIRDLVRNALRMRPDRVVVGECRGPEALDMLQAMNTGHDGSMTTIHANTSGDVILRLEVLVQMAADLPIHSIHRQIASAVDVVVQLARLKDGSRKVVQVTEFVDYDEAEGRIRTKDIFSLDRDAGGAILAPTGFLPTFMGELIEKDIVHLESFYL